MHFKFAVYTYYVINLHCPGLHWFDLSPCGSNFGPLVAKKKINWWSPVPLPTLIFPMSTLSHPLILFQVGTYILWCLVSSSSLVLHMWQIRLFTVVAITWNYYLGSQLFKSLTKYFEDQVPVDFRYRHLIFKWVVVTRQGTSNGSWCMGIKGEMSGTVCVTFTWHMYIYELFIAFVCFVVCSLL